MFRIGSRKDVLTGLLLIAVAGGLAWQARTLPVGTSARMGPGYFPLVLSGLLAFLGLVIAASGLRVRSEEVLEIAWRPALIVTGCVAFFGFAARPLGFLPALAILMFVVAAAGPCFRVTTALINAAAVTVFSWLVFIKALGLPFPLVGPWLGGH